MSRTKDRNLHLFIMFFGAIAVLVGIYEIFRGDTFLEQLSTLLLGSSLFGVGLMHYNETRGKKE